MWHKRSLGASAILLFWLVACAGLDPEVPPSSPSSPPPSSSPTSSPSPPAPPSSPSDPPGTPVTPADIAAWNIDVRPDGAGAPDGRGTPLEGRALFEFGPTELLPMLDGRRGDPALLTTCAGGPSKCAICHGAGGIGGTGGPTLVGGRVSATQPLDFDDPTMTVGSYWPYATTLFDYIRRAMPFDCPQSLTDDEVYAVTAYLLFLNGIIPADQEVNRDNLCQLNVCMPNHGNFYQTPAPYLPKGEGLGGPGTDFEYPCIRRAAKPPRCLTLPPEPQKHHREEKDDGEPLQGL